MAEKIKAVLFDMGGTLEDLYYDDALRLQAARGLRQLLQELDLDPGLEAPDLARQVIAGLAAYQAWREKSEIELPPERVWMDYIFPHNHLPQDKLAAEAERLMQFYDSHFFRRALRPEAPAALAALQERGLRLAVISNVISRGTTDKNLAAYGLAHYFDPVLTSSGMGIRKPNPRIFLEAARLLSLAPAECAYVGDTISRDVSGAHRAGYGLAIQIKSFLTSKSDSAADNEPPDAVIENLLQVIGVIDQAAEQDK